MPKVTKSYTKKYTAKEVAKELFKDRIAEHIGTLTDSSSGSPGWLKHYPRAHMFVFNDLDEDELQECEDTAKRWNKLGPNRKKQSKWVFLHQGIFNLYI